MMTSEELMRSYRESLSEEAFEELVRRYVDLVYTTALRRLNGDTHLAEDVTQTVFCDLALKIRTARAISMLGGWLHQHTCFTSAKVVRAETRRRAHEKQAMNISGNEPDWDEIAPHLDEALAALPPADRHAIVSRFFEKRDFRALGKELGLSDDAAQKRVSRAVDKLRELLARRGVTVSVAALSFTLGACSLEAAPAGLAAKITITALKTSSAAGGLTLLILKIMASTKIKLAVASVLVMGLALVPTVMKTVSRKADQVTRTQTNEPRKSGLNPAKTIGAESASSGRQAPAKDASAAQLRLTVIDATEEKAVHSVQIFARDGRRITSSDREGRADIPYPLGANQLEFFLRKELFADTRLLWEPKNGEIIPDEYTVRLSRAVKISGLVVGPDENPVDGAHVGFGHSEAPAARTRPASHEFFGVETLTDAQGHWEITRVAQDMMNRLCGNASHSAYYDSPMVMLERDPEAAKQLLEGTHVFRLQRAVDITGIVVNGEGKPIPDASVLAGHVSESGARQTKTGADGTFTLNGCAPIGEIPLSAEAPGYAATTIRVNPTTNAGPYKLVLKSGKTLRIKVVNRAGNPIPDADVWLNTFNHGQDTAETVPQTEFHENTDREGKVIWETAPDKELEFEFAARNYMRVDGVKMSPDGQEHVVTLPPALVLSGTVNDATTGQPLPKFRLVLGWAMKGGSQSQELPRWSPIDRFTVDFSAGQFRHVLEEDICGGVSNCVFKIEADGYSPYVSRIIQLDEGELKFDVRLQPTGQTTIKVVLPNGKPAVGASVALVTPTSRFYLTAGGFDSFQSSGTLLTVADNGTIRFTQDPSVTRIVIASVDGFGQFPAKELINGSTVTLLKWGAIEGVYKPKSATERRAKFLLQSAQDDAGLTLSIPTFRVESDASGELAWKKVPPGKFEIVQLTSWDRETGQQAWSHQPLGVYVDVTAGKTTKLSFPGGYTVVVRLILPGGVQKPLFAGIGTPLPKPPPEIIGNSDAIHLWAAQPEIRAQMQRARSYRMTQSSEGLWVAEGVPAGGTYEFESAVIDPQSPNSVPLKRLFELKVPVVVPADPPTGTLDLGELELSPVSEP